MQAAPYPNWNEAIRGTVALCNSVANLEIPKKDRLEAQKDEKIGRSEAITYYYEGDYKKVKDTSFALSSCSLKH